MNFNDVEIWVVILSFNKTDFAENAVSSIAEYVLIYIFSTKFDQSYTLRLCGTYIFNWRNHNCESIFNDSEMNIFTVINEIACYVFTFYIGSSETLSKNMSEKFFLIKFKTMGVQWCRFFKNFSTLSAAAKVLVWHSCNLAEESRSLTTIWEMEKSVTRGNL